MSSDPSRQEAARELLYRLQARKSLASFIDALGIGFTPAKHHELLIRELEAVERGDIERLMVLMPPGSAKRIGKSIRPWPHGAARFAHSPPPRPRCDGAQCRLCRIERRY